MSNCREHPGKEAEDLSSHPDAHLAAEGQVTADTPILEVMALIHATPAPLDVTEKGRVIGQVSPGSILERLGQMPAG